MPNMVAMSSEKEGSVVLLASGANSASVIPCKCCTDEAKAGEQAANPSCGMTSLCHLHPVVGFSLYV